MTQHAIVPSSEAAAAQKQTLNGLPMAELIQVIREHPQLKSQIQEIVARKDLAEPAKMAQIQRIVREAQPHGVAPAPAQLTQPGSQVPGSAQSQQLGLQALVQPAQVQPTLVPASQVPVSQAPVSQAPVSQVPVPLAPQPQQPAPVPRQPPMQ